MIPLLSLITLNVNMSFRNRNRIAKTGRFASKKGTHKKKNNPELFQNTTDHTYAKPNVTQSDKLSLSSSEPELAEDDDSGSDSDFVNFEEWLGETVNVDNLNSELTQWVPLSEFRSVVELDLLAKGLESCNFCSLPLALSNAHGVLHRGLGGWVAVRCSYLLCKKINHLPLSKLHKPAYEPKPRPSKDHESGTRPPMPRGTGAGVFDVNTKAAFGKFEKSL